MKSAVETLGPTRIKLTVEVPFDELKSSLDQAYKKVSEQVVIKGFRRGHVPPALVDQYVGRGTVLEQAINDALPELYGEAVREAEVDILGHPEIEVTELNDGDQLVFTAEVDIRPELELPTYEGLAVTVSDLVEPEAEVEEQIESLRDRFATLSTVERAAETGDFVAIDLAAEIEGEPVEDASATNLSYEVGTESLVDGLDAAIIGLTAGENKEFETQLKAGDKGGETAKAIVTVNSVRAKQVPELDDDFAQTASEFDTLDELRSDLRERLTRVRSYAQATEARDKTLEVLLASIEVPIPQHLLGDEIAYRVQSLDQQLQQFGATREDYAESEGIEVDAIEDDLKANAEHAIKSQFVLDAIAKKEELGVDEAELTEAIVTRAQQARISPEQFAQQVVSGGQLGALMGEVLRGKALGLVLEKAVITDESGNPVDLDALLGSDATDDEDDDDLEIIDASDEDDEADELEAAVAEMEADDEAAEAEADPATTL